MWLTGLLTALDGAAIHLLDSPRGESWEGPICPCPRPAVVPARYEESHVVYGAQADYNGPGEPFGFTYMA